MEVNVEVEWERIIPPYHDLYGERERAKDWNGGGKECAESKYNMDEVRENERKIWSWRLQVGCYTVMKKGLWEDLKREKFWKRERYKRMISSKNLQMKDSERKRL